MLKNKILKSFFHNFNPIQKCRFISIQCLYEQKINSNGWKSRSNQLSTIQLLDNIQNQYIDHLKHLNNFQIELKKYDDIYDIVLKKEIERIEKQDLIQKYRKI
jgi:hypothetical protein